MILIAGGAGYIGSHANKELSRRGLRTVVLDSLVYGHRELARWGEFVQGDLADLDALRCVFKEFSVRAVMHFAAFTYVGESVQDPEKYYHNNVLNTLNLLSVMREFGVKDIVFSSTCSVYGHPLEIPLRETHPLNPENPYGRTKHIIENMLCDFGSAYGLRHVILRYFNAAGADDEGEAGEWHDPETHLIPLVLDAALGRRANIEVFGTDYDTPDGTCIRDYVHVSDLAQGHALALEYLLDKGKSDIFNLGNGNGYSVRQVIDTASEVTGVDIPVLEASRRPGDPPVLVGSSEKILETLGWEPRYTDLKEILATAWNWHRKVFS